MYIPKLKDSPCVPARENRQLIFHRVDIFQSLHKFKTVNICFISLLHKFHISYNLVNFKMTCTSKWF